MKKLALNTFKIAALTNLQSIRGGDDETGLHQPKLKCVENSTKLVVVK